MPVFIRRRKRKPSAVTEAARKAARPIIEERVDFWSRQMGVYPKRVAIRNQRSRWGSASELGNLNFNYRIASLPDEIRDYIVIHELAHLVELNHSAAYWKVVAAHCPQYQSYRKWLREHGARYHAV